MNVVFYLSAVVAVVSTILVITRLNAVHALLFLIVSLLSVALIFYSLGAPYVAALEVIIYAGAIMVLFVFVVMMLNLFALGANLVPTGGVVEPKQVGMTLFGPYLLGVELASMLLLAGLVGAYHLSQRHQPPS
jgi:NADH-quinone oxidoreductase subunit J